MNWTPLQALTFEKNYTERAVRTAATTRAAIREFTALYGFQVRINGRPLIAHDALDQLARLASVETIDGERVIIDEQGKAVATVTDWRL